MIFLPKDFLFLKKWSSQWKRPMRASRKQKNFRVFPTLAWFLLRRLFVTGLGVWHDCCYKEFGMIVATNKKAVGGMPTTLQEIWEKLKNVNMKFRRS